MGQVHENFNPFDKKTIPGSHMKMLKWFWEIFRFHQDTGKNVWVGLHIK